MYAFKKLMLVAALALLVPQIAFSAPTTPKVFGWMEEGLLMPEKTSIKVELDTSAENGSLAVGNITPFDKNGEQWVRFNVQTPKALTGTMVDIPFERKVLRTEKGKGIIGGGHRQIVKMSLCIGNQLYYEDMVLKSQGKKDYTVVLGRSTLRHLGVVDVTLVNTVKPECITAGKPAS